MARPREVLFRVRRVVAQEAAAHPEVELSDEDLALKENLELMVTRSADPKAGVAKLAMETMRSEIKTATR